MLRRALSFHGNLEYQIRCVVQWWCNEDWNTTNGLISDDILRLLVSYTADELDRVLFKLLSTPTITKEAVRNLFTMKLISTVLTAAKEDLLSDKNIIAIELNKNNRNDEQLVIFGDIRGDITSLKQLLLKSITNVTNPGKQLKHWLWIRLCAFIMSTNTKYLFLGSYIGDGPHSFEVLMILCTLKILFPSSIYLLHGYCEQKQIALRDGFMNQLNEIFTLYTACYPSHIYRSGPYKPLISTSESMCNQIRLIFDMFQTIFYSLPYASIVTVQQDKIVCIHGGLSPQMNNID
eukprot:172645_1